MPACVQGLEELGIVDRSQRPTNRFSGEATFHAADSRTQLWVIPTNEELIVARQCVELLQQS